MNFSVQKIIDGLKTHYDRLIAAVTLLMLLSSLLYLAVRVGGAKSMQRGFEQNLRNLKPIHETAEGITISPYSEALKRIQNPKTLDHNTWSIALSVPEKRVWCVDCEFPIPFAAMVCPICQEKQPVPRYKNPEFDGDGDEIPDIWEREQGLDPVDPSDAGKDHDGDGYSTLAEYLAGTDPWDTKSFPPPEHELWVDSIRAQPFKLLFRSKIEMPDGSLKFGINTRDSTKTYFVKLGETVEGFLIENYEAKKAMVNKPGIGEVRADVSELMLKRVGKEITLIYRRPVEYSEYWAILYFKLEDRKFRVKKGDRFDLKGLEYEVLDIDTSKRIVLIKKLQSEKVLQIRPQPKAGNDIEKIRMEEQEAGSGDKEL